MSILTGPEIVRLCRTAARIDDVPVLPYIAIDPFDPERAGPNSYDLTLAPELLIYTPNTSYWDDETDCRVYILDANHDNQTYTKVIPSYGFVLKPGTLYLASTVERTECHGLVPFLEGRSSIGRLGISIHATAGFGDDGFAGRWTLEMSCVQPVRIYPNMRICQIGFETLVGERKPYKGRYQDQPGAVASRLHLGDRPNA
jgi:dCTP deaminase